MEKNEESKTDKTAMFADLAAKLAAGPPQKPVGLVKKSAYGHDDLKQEEATSSEQAQQKLGEVMKDSIPKDP